MWRLCLWYGRGYWPVSGPAVGNRAGSVFYDRGGVRISGAVPGSLRVPKLLGAESKFASESTVSLWC